MYLNLELCFFKKFGKAEINNIHLNNDSIDVANNFKYLRFHLDNNLNDKLDI